MKSNTLLAGTTESDRVFLKELKKRIAIREKIENSSNNSEKEQLQAEYENVSTKWLHQDGNDISSMTSDEYFDAPSFFDDAEEVRSQNELPDNNAKELTKKPVSKPFEHIEPSTFEKTHPLVPYKSLDWDFNEWTAWSKENETFFYYVLVIIDQIF